MPAAATLFQAKNFALQNVWGKFLTPALLQTSMDSWIADLQTVLNQDTPEQFEALGWLVPSQAVNQRLPSIIAQQNEAQVAAVIEVLSRTIERLENVQSLTAPQIAAIVQAYNLAWA